MKIIKRNGSEAVFDITKIISAISKANKVVPEAQRLTKQDVYKRQLQFWYVFYGQLAY